MRIAAIIILVLLTGPAFVGVATAQTQQKASKNSGACSLVRVPIAIRQSVVVLLIGSGDPANSLCSLHTFTTGC